MPIQIFDFDYVTKHLSMPTAISLMEQTLRQEADGECISHLRTAVSLPNTNILGLMPGWIPNYFGVKAISVYHTNRAAGYPSHQGQILLFGSAHGELLASVDAASVTKIRTGAVSAAASKLLANPNPRKIAILGCGAQGESHLEALLSVYSPDTISLWNIRKAGAERLSSKVPAAIECKVCDSPEEAVKEADIICTVTPAKEPFLRAEWIKKGAHINAVGACAPASRELCSDLVAGSAFFGDHTESILHESGDFLFPLKEGRITRNHLRGTIGEILCGKIPGRTSPDEITIFKALGIAVEDLAVARYLYEHC